MTDEQRLKEIRERIADGYLEVYRSDPKAAFGELLSDARLLLNLVDSQVAANSRIERLEAQLNGVMNSLATSQREVERLRGTSTSMRSACIETVRNHFGWGLHVRPILIEALESTTIQEQKS